MEDVDGDFPDKLEKLLTICGVNDIIVLHEEINVLMNTTTSVSYLYRTRRSRIDLYIKSLGFMKLKGITTKEG